MPTPHDDIHQAALRAKQREEALAGLDFHPECEFVPTSHTDIDSTAVGALICKSCSSSTLICQVHVGWLDSRPHAPAGCRACFSRGCAHLVFEVVTMGETR